MNRELFFGVEGGSCVWQCAYESDFSGKLSDISGAGGNPVHEDLRLGVYNIILW
ncbi:hypothetical protein AB6P12_07550 [Streptococcus mutans]|uniref:hypothetical protein n=1 Tax=Streptococcus mutans TaxID=1309 RepID=UPI0038BC1F30